tara:strand:- start:665 stop:1450 length:786 start_codon:yes stop_codon:yes gene_type:complete
MKKIILTIFVSLTFLVTAEAGTDGKKPIGKKDPGTVNDCFEGINRGIFSFNKALDGAIIEPIAKSYRKLPTPVKTSAENFVTNLSNLITIPNNILQGDLKNAGTNSARLIINSTIGVIGLFDPASSFGFSEYKKEDYGQTLGKWGVGPGCYVVLPVLGPSTARDAFGSLITFSGGDAWYNITVSKDTQHFSEFDYYFSRVTSGVDFRAKNIESFENLEKNSMDFYASVKSLYLQDRERKVLNSNKITDTMDDSDWEEIKSN